MTRFRAVSPPFALGTSSVPCIPSESCTRTFTRQYGPLRCRPWQPSPRTPCPGFGPEGRVHSPCSYSSPPPCFLPPLCSFAPRPAPPRPACVSPGVAHTVHPDDAGRLLGLHEHRTLQVLVTVRRRWLVRVREGRRAFPDRPLPTPRPEPHSASGPPHRLRVATLHQPSNRRHRNRFHASSLFLWSSALSLFPPTFPAPLTCHRSCIMAGNLVQWVHQTLLYQQAAQCPDAPTAPPSRSPSTSSPTTGPTASPSISAPSEAPATSGPSAAPSATPTCGPGALPPPGRGDSCGFRLPPSPDYTGRLALRLALCGNLWNCLPCLLHAPVSVFVTLWFFSWGCCTC